MAISIRPAFSFFFSTFSFSCGHLTFFSLSYGLASAFIFVSSFPSMLSIFLLSTAVVGRAVICKATVAKLGRLRWGWCRARFPYAHSSVRFAKEYCDLVPWIHPPVQRVRSHISSSIDDLPDPQPKGRQADPSGYFSAEPTSPLAWATLLGAPLSTQLRFPSLFKLDEWTSRTILWTKGDEFP